ncbi:helix-turn-helix transcriptional regulator [Burkholderia cenocepacia]|uniref:helix-turn-helix transcriptional regulator n=1 Tax=Burkholderia cenocepacia TaxID=95486 RepID=UPI0009FF2CC9|nr:AlpA family phage regulatory protein [Burkholderia cenocepacia]MBR8387643.1 AlpA family phage regulatory protein [Burkholderia cenocepacia]MCW3672898.1 AlpA family phage regulatory protein [Burkholderia cenocepacia]MDC6081471.1 AlpA family phage regulatory protein [Burkholderia cenocepacia]
MSKSNAFTSAPVGLPLDGFSRWENLRRFIPLCRETVRQRELEGRFPRASRLTQRCTVWPNREIHRWMADPLNYRAAEVPVEVTEGA